MEFADYLSEEAVRLGFRAPDKDAALRSLAALLAAPDPQLDEDEVFRLLRDRERLATTGVGSGVAIPHARLAVADFRVVVAVAPDGVPFDAVDGAPASILVAILAPEGRPSAQLTMLARVSRILKDEAARRILLEAPTPAAALELLRTGHGSSAVAR